MRAYANRHEQDAAPRRAVVEPVRMTAPQVGKATRAAQAHRGGEHIHHQPDLYARAVETAIGEIKAVRGVAFPAYIRALRTTGTDAIARQMAVMNAALQLQHMLMVVDQRVQTMWDGKWRNDHVLAVLRREIATLKARAARLGAYRGAEELLVSKEAPDNNSAPSGKTAQDAKIGARREARSARRFASRARTSPAATASTRIASVPPARLARHAPVQRKAVGASKTVDVARVAGQGVASASSPLPHAATIQRAFGKHDISNVRVQIGGAAARAAEQLGAMAFATGSSIAFANTPDLHTAAHEAAHVVQQRRGLARGLDTPGDLLEQHADRVADAVVSGRSAEALLDELGAVSTSSTAVQRKPEQDAKSVVTIEGYLRGHRTTA